MHNHCPAASCLGLRTCCFLVSSLGSASLVFPTTRLSRTTEERDSHLTREDSCLILSKLHPLQLPSQLLGCQLPGLQAESINARNSHFGNCLIFFFFFFFFIRMLMKSASCSCSPPWDNLALSEVAHSAPAFQEASWELVGICYLFQL